MKIGLIQPLPGESRPDYIHEPLGLGYLASYLLRDRPNDQVTTAIAHFAASDAEIANKMEGTQLVGFSATSPMIGHAARIIRQLREKDPELTVAFGGAHGTADPESLLKPGLADVVVRGEGEAAFLELVRALENSTSLDKVKGLSYRASDGSIRHNPAGPLIEDINRIPPPSRELIEQEKFLDWGFKRYGDRGAWVLSSRGCPYDCTYCASAKLWTRLWRPRRPEAVIAEIADLARDYVVDRVNFADDTFTISAPRLEQFCRLMTAGDLPVTWACNVRVDTVEKDAYQLMRRAGCTEVWLGVESGSERILKELNKRIDLEQVKNAFRWAKKAGLTRRAYFLLGSPGETPETIAESERLIEQIEPDRLVFSVFTPYPGCQAHDEAVAGGFQLAEVDWSAVDGLRKPIIPGRHMTIEEIQNQYERLKSKYDPIWG